MRESSPARTPALMMRASWRAFLPGSAGSEPLTPSSCSEADWGDSVVPPERGRETQRRSERAFE